MSDSATCDNCQAIHPLGSLRPAKDLHERVDENGEDPAGECPACGCLCYQVLA